MLISYLFFSRIIDRKRTVRQSLLLGFICFQIASTINVLADNTPWINLITFCIANFVFAHFCFSLKKSTALFYSFLLTALMTSLEVVVIFLLSTFLGNEITAYNSNFGFLILASIMNKSLYFFTCLILTHFLAKKISQPRLPFGLYAYPIGIFICLTLIWYVCAQQELSNFSQFLLAIVSILLFGSTIVLFITYQHGLERENELLLVKSGLERMQTEKAYYEILEHQNCQLMTYAHDAKNHLIAIKNLNTDSRVAHYIETMYERLERYAHHSHSGNPVLDVMINKYTTACQLKGVQFEVDVKLCNLGYVEDFDLVAILGNLLDNALTAAARSEGKTIYLATAFRNTYQIVIVENSCDLPPVSLGNQLLSTKQNKKFHGLGLKSVRKTLEKYHGDFHWEYDPSLCQFTITVMIGEKSTMGNQAYTQEIKP